MAMAEGGPAEQAGIQPAQVKDRTLRPGFVRRYLDTDSADLIVAIEHKRVKTVDELLTEVEKHQPGDDRSGSPWSATASPRTSGSASGNHEPPLDLAQSMNVRRRRPEECVRSDVRSPESQ